MVDHDSTRPRLQLAWARFSNFLLRTFAECRYYWDFKWPYFRTAWGYSHMVGQAGSPICIAHTDMTLTWSKVKVKVTDLLIFQKLHSSTSTSFAFLAWCSQLMGDFDSMGASLQLFGARFLNLFLSWRSRDFEFAICWYRHAEFTAFNLRAGRGYKLVIVTADRPQQAVNTDGNDRQPPCGAFYL